MNPVFPLNIDFKFSLFTELRVTDASGRLIAVVKEKTFSIRDEVRVYADEERRVQTHAMRARGLMAGALDWRARRELRRVDGSEVGALQAQGAHALGRQLRIAGPAGRSPLYHPRRPSLDECRRRSDRRGAGGGRSGGYGL
ncbi:hypothetical protein ACFSC4_12445 [Deinococcus malanensis]|uniref:hypothetical protein n=1 Tax=Deinococcus malanensis TaxID=1706855 RepID=UPI00362AF6BF